MTDQPYTPTTDDLELFKKIAQLRYSNEQLRQEERQRAFDHFEHMLNAIEAAAEQRGAIKALRDAANDWLQADNDANVYAWLHYRADQIEPPR